MQGMCGGSWRSASVMGSSFRVGELSEMLRESAVARELEAAHEAEFIPGGFPVGEAVVHALASAVASGYAAALRDVIDLLGDSAA